MTTDRTRSTRSTADRTVIVGGGVVGACIAHSLARRGRSVVLIERGEIGRAASFGNAGLISVGHLPLPRPGLILKSLRWMFDRTSPLLIVPRADPALWWWLIGFARACSGSALERNMRTIGAMSRATKPLFDQYASEFAIDFEYHADGYMDVFRTEAAFDHARLDAEMVGKLGIKEEPITGAEAQRREPALIPGVAGAIWRTQAAFANPHRFVTGVVESARKLGAEVRTADPVEDIVVENRRAAGVRTASGEFIEGGNVVLAAGAWSTAIARRVGASVPMQPAKGYHVMVDQPPTPLKIACSLGEVFVAATPIGGQLRLAGTLEISGLNHLMRQERLDMLQPGAAKFIQGVSQSRVHSTWCGLRPCAADGLPIIGWAPKTPGLFVATGHAMMGFWLAPVTGELVAQTLCNEPQEIDLNPMRVGRW
jgi:D-amino-acid dehydrogenase